MSEYWLYSSSLRSSSYNLTKNKYLVHWISGFKPIWIYQSVEFLDLNELNLIWLMYSTYI
jgi:hypothetical protein